MSFPGGSQFAAAAMESGKLSASQAIGKPLDQLGSSSGSRPGCTSEINWQNFNYPPLLRVIHYDLEELPSSLSGLVRRLNFSFQLTTCSCLLNFIDNFVVVFSTWAPRRWLLQSLLHLVMLPAAALAVFYAGYRGLAEPDAQLVTKYKVGQPVLGFLYLLMGFVPWGCANGLAKLGSMSKYSSGSVFWTVVIFAESFLWLVNVLLSVMNLYRAHNFDQFSTGAACSTGNRF